MSNILHVEIFSSVVSGFNSSSLSAPESKFDSYYLGLFMYVVRMLLTANIRLRFVCRRTPVVLNNIGPSANRFIAYTQ